MPLAFSQMKGIFEDPKVPLIIAAYCRFSLFIREKNRLINVLVFVLSTFLLILFVFGVLRSRARGSLSGNNSINVYEGRSALYVLYQEGIFRVISSWIAQAVVSVRLSI